MVTAAKGQRGTLSYIDYADGELAAHTITNLSQMQVEIDDSHQSEHDFQIQVPFFPLTRRFILVF